jgi:monoamine oxidase
MEAIDGGSADTQSTLDLYNFTQFSPLTFVYPTNDSLFIPSGYGNFIAELANGLPIQTGMPVTSVDWSGTNVVVRAGSRQFTARTVILTASVNVIKSGSIAFNPVLPATHTSALAGVLMGHAYKALLEFVSNPFNGRLAVQPGQMFQALPLIDGNSPAFLVNYFAQQFPTSNTYVLVFAESDQGLALEQMGPAAAGAALCAQMDKPFPGATAAWSGRILTSNWASNPYTLGCISYCTPGNADARVKLAQSIGDKIWLAGEAINVNVHAHSHVHGAWASGEQAAYGAMRAIGALSQ